MNREQRRIAAGLNMRQWIWLCAHAESKPFKMAWLDKARRQVRGSPETWVRLKAWWRHGFGVSTLTIHADDREGLAPYFVPGTWSLTPEGKALTS